MFWKITKRLEQNVSVILQEFQIIAILENPSKDDFSNSKENSFCRVPLQQIVNSIKVYLFIFFGGGRGGGVEIGEFSRSRHKEQLLLYSSEHIK